MELINPKRLKGKNSVSEQQADDRITNLPGSLLHYVLSFLDIKEVARTSVLSKRRYEIWISIPILDFQSLSYPFPYPLPYRQSNEFIYRETSKFIYIVDRILHLHDMSSIQKLSLRWYYPLNESRVNLWISAAIRRNVEKLSLTLFLDSTFFTPLSLCTCESLVTLELDISPNLYLPKYMSFPKLKHFVLSRVKFSDKYNNQQLFSSCPVLENLSLNQCEWFDIKTFCLSTPSLTVLRISNLDPSGKKYGLENCAFEIHAPLLSLTYWADVPKEFVMSNYLLLAEADIAFGFEQISTTVSIDQDANRSKFDQGANRSKFLRAISHVKCLRISDRTIQVLSFTHDLKNNLPTFHNLRKLDMTHTATNYEALISLLHSAPNLESLTLCLLSVSGDEGESVEDGGDNERYDVDDRWGIHSIRSRCPFLHLKSVYVDCFTGHPSEAMWLELILKQAAALETMTFISPDPDKEVEFVIERLTSLPRASASCVFNFT